MAVSTTLRKLGQFSIGLTEDAPPGVVGQLAWFGRIAVIPGRFNPLEYGDDLLRDARYVGVLRAIEAGDRLTLSGVGMEVFLGDEDGKGDVLETPGVTYTAATFAQAMRAVLPPHGALVEGTFYTGVPGTITNTHMYQTSRTAMDYICETMGGFWRVNGDATVDCGPASAMFVNTPTCIIARKDVAGYDLALKALSGSISSTRDAKDYTTRVVLVAAALAGGTADASVVPYKDPHGNPVRWVRVMDEQDDTLIANAPARAQSALATYNGINRSVRLSTDDFDVAGDFAPGDLVWVYDPDAGLFDTANEVQFRGQTIYPTAVRVLGLTWPVTDGHTVAYRSGDGTWVDLTPWIDWEESGGEVEVADSLAPALTSGGATLGTQVAGGGGGMGDTAVPGVPVFGTFTTSSYDADDGLPRAAVHLSWTEPLNTDGSTIVDGDRYEIRYRPTGSTDWQVAFVAFDQTTATVTNLPPSSGFDWQIRCVDYATPTNYGAWSATTAFTTAQDVTAPPVPAAPTVAGSTLAIQVTHALGMASGGTFNLPQDMDHFEVHVGATSGFTATTATMIGKLKATAAEINGNIPVVGTFGITDTAAVWVRVVAVDRTGNRSPASAAVTATAVLVDSAHISDLTATKITAGTMSAQVVVSGAFKTANSGARVVMDSGGIHGYDSGGTMTVDLTSAGTFSLRTAATGARVALDSTGLNLFNGSGLNTVQLSSTGVFTLRTATSGARTEIDTNGIRLYNSSGTQTVGLNASTGAATFTGDISASAITGSTITGSTLRTAASGARVEIGTSTTNRVDFYSSSGDHGYIQANASGTNAIGVYSNNGAEYFLAVNGTASLNSSGGVISTNSSGSVTMQATGGTQANITCSNAGTVTIIGGSSLSIGASGFNPSITLGGSSSGVTIAGSSGTISLGAATIGIGNAGPAGSGTTLVRNGSGRLVPLSSSRRYKADIQPVDVGPDALLTLKPITYVDQCDVDAKVDNPRRWLGLIAEDIDGGALDLAIIRDADGRPDSLMYERALTAAVIPWAARVEARLAALEA